MTKRLYYDDAYLARFTARVVEQYSYQDKWAVVLDRTAFYPTSGGQPFDQGVLGGQQVLDVLLQKSGGPVLHLLGSELAPGEVSGEINWERRFDHMQQHTGQHILSQAFVQVAQADPAYPRCLLAHPGKFVKNTPLVLGGDARAVVTHAHPK